MDEVFGKNRFYGIQKSPFGPPEFRNIKAPSLKIGLFRAIMSGRNIYLYGGVDAFKNDWAKEIYQNHLINPFRHRCSQYSESEIIFRE